jgi:hypothetical protein
MNVLRLGFLAAPLAIAVSCSVVNSPDDPTSSEEAGECGVANTLSDCGTCGTSCSPANAQGATCASGTCEYTCSDGFYDCDDETSNGCEADGTSDDSCGGCGNVCGGAESCIDGQCCTANAVDCGGSCTDTTSDPLHCGGCNNACPPQMNAMAACEASACTVQCLAGFDDCTMADGCETDVRTDPANCGGCGIPCAPMGNNATLACQMGQCGIAQCDAGFDDCDSMVGNGCEADLNSTTTCGDCNTSCGMGEGCSLGVCSSGVTAFGEFRPAMKCADFVNNGNNYQQYCFTLKGNVLCTGQTSGGQVTCSDTMNGVRFVYDLGATWPMRFTPNTATCMNYNPAFIQNFALAIGYANFNIMQTKAGNSCERTWIDSNGLFQQTAGNSGEAQIYDIEYF